jgi:hypothetical protein
MPSTHRLQRASDRASARRAAPGEAPPRRPPAPARRRRRRRRRRRPGPRPAAACTGTPRGWARPPPRRPRGRRRSRPRLRSRASCTAAAAPRRAAARAAGSRRRPAGSRRSRWSSRGRPGSGRARRRAASSGAATARAARPRCRAAGAACRGRWCSGRRRCGPPTPARRPRPAAHRCPPDAAGSSPGDGRARASTCAPLARGRRRRPPRRPCLGLFGAVLHQSAAPGAWPTRRQQSLAVCPRWMGGRGLRRSITAIYASTIVSSDCNCAKRSQITAVTAHSNPLSSRPGTQGTAPRPCRIRAPRAAAVGAGAISRAVQRPESSRWSAEPVCGEVLLT